MFPFSAALSFCQPRQERERERKKTSISSILHDKRANELDGWKRKKNSTRREFFFLFFLSLFLTVTDWSKPIYLRRRVHSLRELIRLYFFFFSDSVVSCKSQTLCVLEGDRLACKLFKKTFCCLFTQPYEKEEEKKRTLYKTMSVSLLLISPGRMMDLLHKKK